MLNSENIMFNPETHIYMDMESGVILPSVTQIVSALLPRNYAGVPESVLQDAADRGKAVHAEIEAFEKEGTEGKSAYFQGYKTLKETVRWKELATELLVANDDYVPFAGTVDKIIELNGQKAIADVKCIYALQKDRERVQLSLYNLAVGLDAKVGYIIWLHKDGVAELVEIELYNAVECARLLDMYAKGEELRLPPAELKTVGTGALAVLENCLLEIKRAEEAAAEIKAQILAEMETRKIEQIRVGQFVLSYVAPTTRKSVDGKKLAAEWPDAYAACQKVSEVKSSLRIKAA